MQSNMTETLVGAGVVAVALGFFLYASHVTGSGTVSGSGGYRLSAEFDNVEGINVGTDVRLAGIKVGTVVGQSLNPESYQAKVDFIINKSITLSDDTSAKVTSEGLLGGKFIALEPGGGETKLAEGGVISYTQGAVDLWSLISKAMFEKSGGKSGEAEQPSQ